MCGSGARRLYFFVCVDFHLDQHCDRHPDDGCAGGAAGDLDDFFFDVDFYYSVDDDHDFNDSADDDHHHNHDVHQPGWADEPDAGWLTRDPSRSWHVGLAVLCRECRLLVAKGRVDRQGAPHSP